MKKMTCAFTGHRPNGFPWGYDETSKECIALKNVLNHEITRLVDEGVTQFLTGMAEGVDSWAAMDVLTLREKNPTLKLHCILPCKTQADEWSDLSKELYCSILKQADSIVYVNRIHRKNCMLERNRFMVDHAGVLLAVYKNRQRSGTAATVRYAQKKGREIWSINPTTLEITHQPSAETAEQP